MIETLYELLTGRSWTTTRSMMAEFGPPPAARHPELARYSDAELYERGAELVAELDAATAAGRRPDLPLPVAYRDLTAHEVARAA
ncbi:hypothetical protein JQS43_24405 [Natronosporangium hydrolyticum]|uniref:Uncharacterized protein n=1 Tax=Natronosporangium hydrolyticum TaxID=2811111 RepID=A0A895YA07_9ACTN|nr:hypothetical protein [Natronosporangium hydrolyticum]QSB14577.1 hypothetical protein JQS43_24405 [Natronosporangium hydrolyticum]